MLDLVVLRGLAHTELQIAWFQAEECARCTADLVDEISGSAFATVRQRIAHHLHSMARSLPEPPFLVAHITDGSGQRTFEYFGKAIDERSMPPWFLRDPPLDTIRADPRFERRLQRMGLPP